MTASLATRDRAPLRSPHIAALASAIALASASLITHGTHGAAYASKPAPPVAVTARLLATDPAAGTAQVQVTIRTAVKVHSISVRCEPPKDAAQVQSSSTWSKDPQGRTVLAFIVTLPPYGGKLVIRADVKGDGIAAGTVAAVDLPPRAAAKSKTEPPTTIKTTTGEELRLHK